MDEPHLLAAARYVERNPVRAKLVPRARDWRWSSAAAHLDGRDDALCTVAPLLEPTGGAGKRWAAFLDENPGDEDAFEALRAGERTGRPVGADDFVAGLEARLGRPLARRRPGRKPAEPEDTRQAALPLK